MANEDGWARYRQRIIEGTQQEEILKAWQTIAELTKLPLSESVPRLRTLVIDQMDEPAFVTFRNAMILVNNTYSQRAGLLGVQDPVEWERRYLAYMREGDPEAPQYENYFHLRAAMDQMRKPKDQSPPYSEEELELSQRCNELFNSLALIMSQASWGTASQEVVDELTASINEHRALLANYTPENRGRRQVLEAIASATYAIGRLYGIMKDYAKSGQYFQSALEQYEALNDSVDAQMCRQQLAALRAFSGAVDEVMRANLELLLAAKDQPKSLEQAAALVGQMKQVLNANDTFEAAHLLNSALQELRPYPDPRQIGPDKAFEAWVEMVPAALRGNDFLRELARVMQLYADTLGARAMLNGDVQAEQQLGRMAQLTDRIFTESIMADEDLQRRFMAADARPLAIYRAAAAAAS